MTRTQKRRLLWNGVIYGVSFGIALFVAALLQPAHELKTPMGSASLDAPATGSAPVNAVAEAIVP
jgi:hypothetical protein